MATDARIGIDLGGTKIEGIVLGVGGLEVARERVSTPRSYDGTLSAIVKLVQCLEQKADAHATVGVGIPGVVVPSTGLVKNANSTWLNNRPLAHDLSALLRRPVLTENDANCFALSEATDGAAAGASVVFGVIMGTGVGGGVVCNGAIHRGANLIGGEWGHNPLPWPAPDEIPGPLCYCGRSGCIETWISGPGVARDHERSTGVMMDAAAIMAAAKAGDAAAIATHQRWIDRTARGLATVINLLDPDMIVLGGGLSNVDGLANGLLDRLPPLVFTTGLCTRVVANHHGDSSGVRGAAWLWPPDSPVVPTGTGH